MEEYQREFDLESILSVLTGINCTNDFYKVFELYWFMFEDDLINISGIQSLNSIAKNHILRIHPELKNIKFNNEMNLDLWLTNIKNIYGNTMTISIIGEPIVTLNKKSYHSNR